MRREKEELSKVVVGEAARDSHGGEPLNETSGNTKILPGNKMADGTSNEIEICFARVRGELICQDTTANSCRYLSDSCFRIRSTIFIPVGTIETEPS